MSAPACVSLRLHGVSVTLTSELESFARYVATAMAAHLCAADEQPAVSSHLEWVDAPAVSSLEGVFGNVGWQERPDRHLYLDGDTAYWLHIDDFTDLKLRARYRNDSLCLTGRYYFQLGRGGALEKLRRLRHHRDLDRLMARRFSTLLYYLVYHPVLWELGRRSGYQVLHAAAASCERGAVVLGGLPGCGKSSLAVAMLADPHWTMLSDNLLLHDGTSVRACPELLLLDRESRRLAGAGADRMKGTGEQRLFGRDAYRPDRVELEPRPLLAVFDVRRANETTVREIEAAECASRLAAANTMAKEVRRIDIMARVLDMIAGSERPDEDTALRRLVSGCRCYALRVAEGTSLVEVARDHICATVGAGEGGA